MKKIFILALIANTSIATAAQQSKEQKEAPSTFFLSAEGTQYATVCLQLLTNATTHGRQTYICNPKDQFIARIKEDTFDTAASYLETYFQSLKIKMNEIKEKEE